MLLAGGDSPPASRAGIAAAAAPPGQQHVAMYTAPEIFAREVLAFLAGPE